MAAPRADKIMPSDNPEKWHQVKEIFYAALPLAPAERVEFLDRLCKGDETLRREVESMLSSSEAAGSFMRSPAVAEVAETIADGPERLHANQTFSHYRVISSLGRGGMGEVYLAEDTRLRRKVALKVLSKNIAGDKERLDRFEREANAASALNHPNILTVHEFGFESDIHFLATEFVDGETLREKIKDASLSLPDALDVAEQTSFALLTAHASGIIHRDIKPENIMIRRDGIVKVLDFGLAKLIERNEVVSDAEAKTRALLKTKPGVIMGTASYMSPEQAKGREVDERSDIFSFGVVLYEMVAGIPPFDGDNAMDVISSILHNEPAPLHRLMPEISPDLERVINKTLRKDLAERYQTLKDVRVDLRDIKQNFEFQNKLERSVPPFREKKDTRIVDAMTAASHATSSAEYITSEIKKHKYVLLAMLVFLLLAVGRLGFWYFNDRSAAIKQIASIAVLPFQNDSESGETEYLSDGMTESLITRLAQLPKLNVKARSSVFRYKGKEDEVQRIGKELNVDAILTGRIVQRGDDLTLYITLVDTATERVLWKSDYNRSMTNLITLQGDVARDVSNKLLLKLSGADEQRLTKTYTTNAEAYQLYMKGYFYLLKGINPETDKSLAYFQQAIEADPNYALAYVGLSDSYRGRVVGGGMSSTEFMPKARAAAAKAIEIDDTLAEAHAALGHIIFWYDWNWNAAEDQYKLALELDPNSVDSLKFYAHLLSCTGRHAEALAKIKRAREIDPLNLGVSALEGLFLLHAGQTDEAIARLQKTLDLDPNFRLANAFAARAYSEKGMFAEADAAIRKARELYPDGAEINSFGAYNLAKAGKLAKARSALDEMLKLSIERYVAPYSIALVYNALGEREKTLDYLEKAFAEKDVRMVFLKVEPKWNNLRNEPRFIELMRRMKFDS